MVANIILRPWVSCAKTLLVFMLGRYRISEVIQLSNLNFVLSPHTVSHGPLQSKESYAASQSYMFVLCACWEHEQLHFQRAGFTSQLHDIVYVGTVLGALCREPSITGMSSYNYLSRFGQQEIVCKGHERLHTLVLRWHFDTVEVFLVAMLKPYTPG